MASPPSSTAALFSAFDRNQDGRLNFEDLRQGFAESGYEISNEDLKVLMQRFDQDNDGALDFSEMLTVMAMLQKKEEDMGEMKKVFDLMDKNGNKRISKSELKRAMALYCDTVLTNQQVDDIMKDVDFDNDGYLSFKEFSKCISLFQGK